MAKKRKYGSGTVRKRSDGRWEARVVIGYDDSGNPKTKNVLAKTKAECLVKLEELKDKYAPPVTKCKPDIRNLHQGRTSYHGTQDQILGSSDRSAQFAAGNPEKLQSDGELPVDVPVACERGLSLDTQLRPPPDAADFGAGAV